MKSERLASWLQVIANIGIIGGLVLVGVQLNQNTEMMRLQELRASHQAKIDNEIIYAGEKAAEVWAKIISIPLELNLEERRIAEALIWTVVETWRHNYVLHVNGLLSEQDWKHPINVDAAYFLNHPFGRVWWDNYDVPGHVYDETGEVFRNHVRGVIERASPNRHIEHDQELMIKLKAYIEAGVESK